MSGADDDLLIETRAGGVTTLTLNRPAALNTLSGALLGALQASLDRLSGDAELRCLVIAARGSAFCAGHDLKEMQACVDKASLQALFSRCSAVMQGLRSLPVPVIAVVQGAAVAAGCQLVAACDLAIAAEGARFAVSGINLGLFCSTPAVPLSRAIGPKAALDMLLTGRVLDAAEALTQGLVSRIVPDDALPAAAQAYAAEVASKSPEAVRIGKAMFYAQEHLPLPEAYLYAGEVMAQNMMGAEAREGVEAFLTRRGTR